MKKLVVIVGLICLSSVAFAQGQRPNRSEPPSIEEHISKAKTALNLSDEQVIEWKEIHSKYETDLKEKATAEIARKDMDEELKATLNDEQLKKFNEQPKGRPSRR